MSRSNLPSRPIKTLLWPLLLALAPSACMAPAPQVRIDNQSAIHDLSPQPAAAAHHELILSIAYIDAWSGTEIRAAVRQAAKIMAQCGIRTTRADLKQVAVPPSHRDFDTPRSRELARVLALPKPALFFIANTRQTPAFDAEAIGRGNSRTRPELTDTVWITRGARDLGIVIAHELAHVLMDSGAHNAIASNLMNTTTTPQNTQLTAAQCTQITSRGGSNSLLRGVN